MGDDQKVWKNSRCTRQKMACFPQLLISLLVKWPGMRERGRGELSGKGGNGPGRAGTPKVSDTGTVIFQ